MIRFLLDFENAITLYIVIFHQIVKEKMKRVSKQLQESIATVQKAVDYTERKCMVTVSGLPPIHLHRLLGAIHNLQSEVRRLKAGDFTEDEFQNLCHKMNENNGPQKFCDGCEAYQQKLFGWSPITELKKKCE